MVDYPKSFDPIPETKYVIQMVGGKIPEDKKREASDDRYPRPMIFKKQYDKKDGTGKYWGWSVGIFAKEIRYVDGKPETDDDTLGEYTFWIPEEVREQVDELFEAGIYKFYLRRKSVWYKDSKGKNKTKSLYQVSAGLSGLKDEEELITKTYDVKPSKKKEITSVEFPFDDDMGDDEVAFKEDIKPEKEFQTISEIDYTREILVTLQNIEEDLRKISNSFINLLDICKGVRLIKREKKE